MSDPAAAAVRDPRRGRRGQYDVATLLAVVVEAATDGLGGPR
jgi:hypothetical protein